MNKSSFFIVGKHAVFEALKNEKRKILKVFLTEESKKNIHRLSPKKNLLKDVKIYFKTKKELDKYSKNEGILHQGYVAEIEHLDVKERHFPKESKLMYKSASGCVEHLNIFEVSNINTTLKFLRDKNFWIYGFDSKSNKDFMDIKWEGNNILLFGSEGSGIKHHTNKYTDFSVKIKINENVESLNISNSAAIVFHHINQHKKIS